jgi:N-glycosylase/DNA lyase
MDKDIRNDILVIYDEIKDKIVKRLEEFKLLWRTKSNDEIFAELSFCLLTPQSKAVTCWECIKKLQGKELLLSKDKETLSDEIKGYARFHTTKAQRIVEARKLFTVDGKIDVKSPLDKLKRPFDKREWVVSNVKGLGYKEASHFLRNVGFGDDLAILDRHIYKNLKLLGVIDAIPKSVTKKKYLDIEKQMNDFSRRIKIPLSHLDFVLWYKEAGQVFK